MVLSQMHFFLISKYLRYCFVIQLQLNNFIILTSITNSFIGYCYDEHKINLTVLTMNP